MGALGAWDRDGRVLRRKFCSLIEIGALLKGVVGSAELEDRH